METLVAHRVSSGLPGVSLQIGPWSSSKAAQDVKNENHLVYGLEDDEGVRLILAAMCSSMKKEDRGVPCLM